jgi:hypothetical protein
MLAAFNEAAVIPCLYIILISFFSIGGLVSLVILSGNYDSGIGSLTLTISTLGASSFLSFFTKLALSDSIYSLIFFYFTNS